MDKSPPRTEEIIVSTVERTTNSRNQSCFKLWLWYVDFSAHRNAMQCNVDSQLQRYYYTKYSTINLIKTIYTKARKFLHSKRSATFSKTIQLLIWLFNFTFISVVYRLLDRLVVEWWLRVRKVPGSIPSHIKDSIKWYQVVSLFTTQHWKGKYRLFLKNKYRKKNVMHKIWDRKSFEVGGH